MATDRGPFLMLGAGAKRDEPGATALTDAIDGSRHGVGACRQGPLVPKLLINVDQGPGVLADAGVTQEGPGHGKQQCRAIAGWSHTEPTSGIVTGRLDEAGDPLLVDRVLDGTEAGSPEVGRRHRRRAIAARPPAYRVSLWAVWCRHQRQYLRSSMRSLVLVLFLVVT